MERLLAKGRALFESDKNKEGENNMAFFPPILLKDNTFVMQSTKAISDEDDPVEWLKEASIYEHRLQDLLSACR